MVDGFVREEIATREAMLRALNAAKPQNQQRLQILDRKSRSFSANRYRNTDAVTKNICQGTSYSRHRYLEVAGRYEEIFVPDMMSMDPVYHFHQAGVETVVRGQDQVKSFYRTWA